MLKTVNLLDNAYAGSNPALPTIFIINDLGSRKAPFLLCSQYQWTRCVLTFWISNSLFGRLETATAQRLLHRGGTPQVGVVLEPAGSEPIHMPSALLPPAGSLCRRTGIPSADGRTP